MMFKFEQLLFIYDLFVAFLYCYSEKDDKLDEICKSIVVTA